MSRRADEEGGREVDVSDRDRTERRDHVADRGVGHDGPGAVGYGNGTAIAAFVLGLLALTLTFTIAAAPVAAIMALAALFMAFKGVGNANAMGGHHKGLAITGAITAALALLLIILGAIAGVYLFNEAANNPELQQQIDELRQNVEQNIAP